MHFICHQVTQLSALFRLVQTMTTLPIAYKDSNFLYNMIYLLTAIGLSSGGSSTVHICTQTIHRTTQSTETIHRKTQQFWKSADRAPSWRVIPWYLPYNRGKSTEKPQSG